MKHFFNYYILPFLIASIAFVLTLICGEAANQEDWAPKLYGHFFPIFQAGPSSLSIQLDPWKFLIDLALFYTLFLGIFKILKVKTTKLFNLVTVILFLIITFYFGMIITFDLSFTKITNHFNYSTVKPWWFSP